MPLKLNLIPMKSQEIEETVENRKCLSGKHWGFNQNKSASIAFINFASNHKGTSDSSKSVPMSN